VRPAIAEVADRYGRIDALVNSAGVAMFKPILETTFEKRARVLAVDRGFEATGIGLPPLRRTQNER
jgi:NAD(P)-dependent dehydrogenase (short-subunit alcohol dehydrogenase family)